MKGNAIKTAFIFIGIIFFVLMGRLFFNEHELLVNSDNNQVANTACGQNSINC